MKNLIEKKGYLYKTNSRQGISSNFINKEVLKTKLNHYDKVLSIAEKINVKSDIFNENEILDFFKQNSILAKKVKLRLMKFFMCFGLDWYMSYNFSKYFGFI